MSNSDHTPKDNTDTPVSSVLFVCGMNCIRSPMAERLLKDLCGTKIYCDSAGVNLGEPDGFAIAVMKERGLDMENHHGKTLEELDDLYFDLIVTLSPEAHHKALDLTTSDAIEVEYWPTLDPSTIAGSRDEILAGYRKVRDSLEEKIRKRFVK